MPTPPDSPTASSLAGCITFSAVLPPFDQPCRKMRLPMTSFAAAQPAQRALGIERSDGLFVDVGAFGIVMGETAETVRLAARSKTIRKQRE